MSISFEFFTSLQAFFLFWASPSVKFCNQALGQESKFLIPVPALTPKKTLSSLCKFDFIWKQKNLIIWPWVLNQIFSKNGTFQFDRYTRVHETKYSFFSRKINYFRVLEYFKKNFLNLKVKVCILIQEIFVNPSLGNPSDLTSVTLFRERDTFKYIYMYFFSWFPSFWHPTSVTFFEKRL